MNDFTQEELSNLLSALNELILEITQPPCIHEIMIKIESMIDNYCEHECVHELHSVRDELPLSKTTCCGEELVYANTTWSIPKCHKCGRVLNEKK